MRTSHGCDTIKNFCASCILILLGCSSIANAQVVSSLQIGSRVNTNTRVFELARVVDSLQTALEITDLEIAPVERSNNRAMARLDETALRASFTEMFEELGIEQSVPTRITPKYILSTISTILLAAAEMPPKAQSEIVTALEQTLATLNGAIVKDGRKQLLAWGFKFGTDSALTDSILVPFDSIPFGSATYGDFLDTSAVDTGAFYLTQRNLSPSSTYFYSAWGENVEGIGHGDTLSFVTLLGVTTEKANGVSDSTGTIGASVMFGDVQPSTVGLKWSENADLSSATDSVIALGADSTIAFSLVGLTKDSTYYYSAYGTNSSGTAYGDTLSFVAKSDPCIGMEAFTYQANAYDLIAIGSQCWFAENLRNDSYANGDAIEEVLDSDAWPLTTSGAQAIYDGDSATYFADYGRLYNWYAVTDSRGLCPNGWHVPTHDDWTELVDLFGGYLKANPSLISSETDSPSWDGTNSSGFSALPGGRREGGNANFEQEGTAGFYWSSSFYVSESNARYRKFFNGEIELVYTSSGVPTFGFSVRCLLN